MDTMDPTWTISTSDIRRAPPPTGPSSAVIALRDSLRPPPAPPDDDGDPPDPAAGEDVDAAGRQTLRGPPSAYRSISWNPIIPSSEAL